MIEEVRPRGASTMDSYCWDLAKNGHYTVKSGYWVAANIVLKKQNLQELNQPSLDPLYQFIWNLDTSPKDESVNHLLFQCPFARLVWTISPISEPPDAATHNTLFTNLYRALTVINKAKEDSEEWAQRKEVIKLTVKPLSASVSRSSWRPPPDGWLKCNVDGARDDNHRRSGIGWILRDSNGEALWAGTKSLPLLKSVIDTEAEALRWAMVCISNLSYKNVFFESDSKTLVDALKDETPWPIISSYHQDIQLILSSPYAFRICFYPRDGNRVADRMAKEAFSLLNHASKLFSIMPDCVLSFIEEEKQSCN
ncbi:uncharacterized protein LOC112086773 [Eutrema salsugineum]|uniref:uncharacterized protein LOC112086773 n=1 Tax=Eutrema salsugineum TaxID=72664 RepID=UPI000CED6C40|nr:uncharacterized protein LOC112086773 [Eutrema salsugineum]